MIGVAVESSESLQEKTETRVDRLSEEFGLDTGSELDRVEVDYLPPHVTAQTRFDGAGTEIVFNRHRFFDLPGMEQRRTILHELIHVKQFNRSLGDWLEDRFSVSSKFVEQMSGQNRADMEGNTELITDRILPGSMASSYPEEKNRRERELQMKGIDPGEELVREVEELEQEVLADNPVEGGNHGVEYLATGRDFNYGDFQDEYLEGFGEGAGIETYLEQGSYDRSSPNRATVS